MAAMAEAGGRGRRQRQEAEAGVSREELCKMWLRQIAFLCKSYHNMSPKSIVNLDYAIEWLVDTLIKFTIELVRDALQI